MEPSQEGRRIYWFRGGCGQSGGAPLFSTRCGLFIFFMFFGRTYHVKQNNSIVYSSSLNVFLGLQWYFQSAVTATATAAAAAEVATAAPASTHTVNVRTTLFVSAHTQWLRCSLRCCSLRPAQAFLLFFPRDVLRLAMLCCSDLIYYNLIFFWIRFAGGVAGRGYNGTRGQATPTEGRCNGA